MKNKLKTKKSAAKRFTLTATGKIRCSKSGKRHLLGKKSANPKRLKRNKLNVDKTNQKAVKHMLLLD